MPESNKKKDLERNIDKTTQSIHDAYKESKYVWINTLLQTIK